MDTNVYLIKIPRCFYNAYLATKAKRKDVINQHATLIRLDAKNKRLKGADEHEINMRLINS
jgi:hypothetical protein